MLEPRRLRGRRAIKRSGWRDGRAGVITLLAARLRAGRVPGVPIWQSQFGKQARSRCAGRTKACGPLARDRAACPAILRGMRGRQDPRHPIKPYSLPDGARIAMLPQLPAGHVLARRQIWRRFQRPHWSVAGLD